MTKGVLTMKATMKDVAALAGVGVGTVSRVINNVKVKDGTYKKVMNAIDELGYVPDHYARGLKTNKSNTIALIIPTIWHPFFSEFAYYVEEELSKNNYKLFLCNADGSNDKEKEYLQMVRQSKVDGIIGITYSDIDKYVSSNLPFVSIDRHFSEAISYVTADNYEGGKIAAKQLILKGSKHLAYIGGTSPYPNETNKRKLGFYEYIKMQDIKLSVLDMPEPIINLEDHVEEFISKNPSIDGIFTVNDFMALDVIKCLIKLGKKIPEDIQVIGFDGIKIAEDKEYLVSTIVQPISEMAKEAVKLIMGIVYSDNEPQRITLPVSYHAGWSTKS